MNYHAPFVIKLRNLARRSGLLKIIKPILAGKNQSYEEQFHHALKQAVRPGDIVWDVGANVGLYTDYFLQWTGSNGRVVAFEPLPAAVKALTKVIDSYADNNRGIIVAQALSDKPGKAFFNASINAENVTTTAHLSDSSDSLLEGITVQVTTADEFLAEQPNLRPNVVKIDVEGFEEDVLKGGDQTFSDLTCRHLLIEMHFTRMVERNLGDSASRIVSILKKWGYRVQWIDPSHIQASR